MVRRFRPVAGPLAISLAALALAACGGSGSDDELAHVRLVNLITDAPTVSLDYDGTSLGAAAYGAVTTYAAARQGSHALTLSYLVPSNQTTSYTASYTKFGPSVTQDVVGQTDYTLFATGTFANPHLVAVTGKDQRDAVADNHFDFRIANAAPAAGPLSVTITFPEGGITSPKDLGSLSAGQVTDSSDVTLTSVASAAATTLSGTVTLQFKNAAGTVILDSGPISIAEQTRLLFVATDRVGPGTAPISMLVINGIGAGQATIDAASTDGAEFNFANTSPDVGPIDLIAGSSSNAVYATNIGFGQQSPFTLIPNQQIGTIATPTGNHGSFLFVQQVTPSPNGSYTIYSYGPLASIAGFLIADDRRSVPTEAHVRFINAASSLVSAGVSDIYIVPTGTALDLTATTHLAASVASLPYLTPSSYVPVAGSTYDIRIYAGGTTGAVLGPQTLPFPNGSVQTVILVDKPDGTLGLLAFDDARH